MARRAPVRHRLSPTTRTRRTAGERFALRLPTLATAQSRRFFKQPPQALLRRRLFPRLISSMMSALNRRDWELFAGPPYGPNEVSLAETGRVGLQASYREPEAMRRMIEDWEESWQEFRSDPLELIDFGDRYVILMRYQALGTGSGIKVEDTAACLVIPPGNSFKVQLFWDSQAALSAAEREPKPTAT